MAPGDLAAAGDLTDGTEPGIGEGRMLAQGLGCQEECEAPGPGGWRGRSSEWPGRPDVGVTWGGVWGLVSSLSLVPSLTCSPAGSVILIHSIPSEPWKGMRLCLPLLQMGRLRLREVTCP